jgi:hypothetical protein
MGPPEGLVFGILGEFKPAFSNFAIGRKTKHRLPSVREVREPEVLVHFPKPVARYLRKIFQQSGHGSLRGTDPITLFNARLP